MSTTTEDLRKALDLLQRVEDASSQAPDPEWYRDYFLLTKRHMILTEDGWENGENKQAYLDNLEGDDVSDVIFAEVNAPTADVTPEQHSHAEALTFTDQPLSRDATIRRQHALVCKLRGQLEQANQSLDTANAALNLYGNQIQARDAVIVELNGIIERSLGKELSALRLAQDLAHGGPEHDDTHTPVEWRVFIQIYNNQGEQYATEPEIRESKLLAVAGLAVAAIQSSRRKRDA